MPMEFCLLPLVCRESCVHILLYLMLVNYVLNLVEVHDDFEIQDML